MASPKGIIVLANRAPFAVTRPGDGRISTKRSASGLVTALEPLVSGCSGTWVAHGAALDGRDERLLEWITDSGLSILAADNYAVEAVPSRPGSGDRHPAMPLHEHCLVKLGVHLGEIWYMTELAQHLRQAGRSRFLLTAPPLRLPGAVGSPTTPIATV